MQPGHTLMRCVPSPDDLRFFEDRLYEFNRDQTGQDDGELFAFFIKDAGGEVVAGLSGWTWARACEIQWLWVQPAWRGQGYGRRLLGAAEEQARGRGCDVIALDTYSFQAPGFYQKCGYELVWELENFPRGHRRCFLVKRLA